ncbi:MAG TPA: hypothetical protein VMI92_09645 [Steroidobacteraceae bacterium]|nr:hypothetical protein [Steroidobacteraceae bacterium]
MGSAIAVAVSLSMTGVVFLLIPEYAARVRAETPSLLIGLAWSWALAALAVASVIGELRLRAWRGYAQLALLAAVAWLMWDYWPRK